MSIGSRAHELAMYVMYDMFIGYLCDNPMEYGKHPEIMKYLRKVPAAWDESVPLDGKVGEYAVMAKRSGNAWFVAGMTNETGRTLEVDLSFLPDGGAYSARIYRDDGEVTNIDAKVMQIEDLTVTSGEKLSVDCANEGGFVMQVFEKGSPDDPDVLTAAPKVDANSRGSATAFYVAAAESLAVKCSENIRAVTVVNMQGSVVAAQRFAGNAAHESLHGLAHLPAGVYIVNVETHSGAYVAKFFKD
jgi:alpha-glucosidase